MYSILNTYSNSLEPRSFSFDLFFHWFDKQQKIKLQKGENKNLEYVTSAILSVLNDEKNQYEKLEILWGEIDEMVTYKNGQKVNILQMSSGEKSLFALIGDIARRLVIANQHSNSPLDGTGIVLIDEIDLHLHPKWQRLVVPALTTTFPNVQFIITTHSALVLRRLKREQVLILKNSQILSQNPYFEGRDSNSILEDIFGIEMREKDYQEKISKIYQLIDKHELDEAENQLSQLIEIFGDYDSEVMRIKSYIDLEKD